MNAPATAAALAKPDLQLIALGAITPSDTHIQQLRRTRFNKEALKELADSIRANGLVNPPVVRPLGNAKYELVAGERRFLACKLVPLEKVFCSVRDLTDDQVLEIQLIENLQREDLHELEEAEGYEELMKLKKITADQVGDMVGKSRSYVYARTKLLALSPAARKDFYAGTIDASTALLIARIPHHDLQKQAIELLNEWRQDGEIQNFKDAQRAIRDNFMLRLKEAPFDPKDANLVAKAGACGPCPKRTGNQSDLFGDVKDADVCTDPKCFQAKREAHYAADRKALEAKGAKIIHGDAAKKIFRWWENGNDATIDSYKSLDATTYLDNGASKKVRDIVGPDYEPVLVQHPLSGKIYKLATAQAIAKASGKPERKSSAGSGYNYAAAQRRAKAAGPDVDEMLTERLAQLVHKAAPKEFGKAWLLSLARLICKKLNLRDQEAIAVAFDWPKSSFRSGYYNSGLPTQAGKLGERDLVLLMFHLVFATRWGRGDVLKLFDVNEQKTRELIIEERKAAAKKAREAAKAEKEAKAAKKKRPVDKLNAAIDKRAAKAKAKKSPKSKSTKRNK